MEIEKMTTEKLIWAIVKSLEQAAYALQDGHEKEAEEILQYTLFRWFYHRPFMLHTQN